MLADFSHRPNAGYILTAMSEAHREPAPFSELIIRAGLPATRVSAAEAIGNASAQWQLIEDYTPVAESLECRLATLQWVRHGISPFAEGHVPFAVNNNGRLSENAAALLFANCVETAPLDDRIVVLELGAGTGLFARYFLDEFRRLCEHESRNFYQRLSYYVTDRSPRTVEQWEERGVFREHASHAIAVACDAVDMRGIGAARIHAAFCNYLLDVLPSAVVRRREQGWEQVAVRTSIKDDARLLRYYTTLTFDQIRELASSPDPEAQAKLLPLLPILEVEGDFMPIDSRLPGLDELQCEPGGAPSTYNYGAIECLECLLGRLDAHGFVLVNDYYVPSRGGTADETGAHPSIVQRYGPTIAMPLNFSLLEDHFGRGGVTVLKPNGDNVSGIHARLLLRGALPSTRQTFEARFASAAREHADAPMAQACQAVASGDLRQALASFRTAIERNPRDWLLIGEAAEFVSTQLKDHATAIELAREALELNPWYSPGLWRVMGDCLTSLRRPADAHECYLQAQRIHPGDVQTYLKLAESWLALGNPRRCLEEVAQGLANDSDAMFRHVLLEKQQQAIAELTICWHAERETMARRQG